MVSSEIANRREANPVESGKPLFLVSQFYFTFKETVWQVDDVIRTQFFQSC
jgi:hypothetical protein